MELLVFDNFFASLLPSSVGMELQLCDMAVTKVIKHQGRQGGRKTIKALAIREIP